MMEVNASTLRNFYIKYQLPHKEDARYRRKIFYTETYFDSKIDSMNWFCISESGHSRACACKPIYDFANKRWSNKMIDRYKNDSIQIGILSSEEIVQLFDMPDEDKLYYFMSDDNPLEVLAKFCLFKINHDV